MTKVGVREMNWAGDRSETREEDMEERLIERLGGIRKEEILVDRIGVVR